MAKPTRQNRDHLGQCSLTSPLSVQHFSNVVGPTNLALQSLDDGSARRLRAYEVQIVRLEAFFRGALQYTDLPRPQLPGGASA